MEEEVEELALRLPYPLKRVLELCLSGARRSGEKRRVEQEYVRGVDESGCCVCGQEEKTVAGFLCGWLRNVCCCGSNWLFLSVDGDDAEASEVNMAAAISSSSEAKGEMRMEGNRKVGRRGEEKEGRRDERRTTR